MTPIVAIVGRPNVGKSTLFNRLAGENLAIVHDVPGVTRDRHYADAHVHGRDITLVDTGGFDPGTDDPLGRGIARHVEAAIAEADVVICVLDGTAAPLDADREAVALLRRSDKPVVFVANKADNDRAALDANDLYSLGIDTLFAVSALHGRGLAEMESALVGKLQEPEPAEESKTSAPRVALLGRPNAGKSSLFNVLSGSERSLVDHRPGTTVDPVDTEIEYRGRRFVLVDTAGVRRKSKVSRGVESASVIRAIRAVGRAEIIVVMADAAVGVAEQDARLLGLAIGRGRAVAVALNKMDLLDDEGRQRAISHARDTLHFAPWVPVVSMSVQTRDGVNSLMEAVGRAADAFQKRVPTAELNRFFRDVLERHPPPSRGGRAPRIYFVTQAETAPPVFVVKASAPDRIATSYRRFVTNQIRKKFDFDAAPVIVHFRPRSRRDER